MKKSLVPLAELLGALGFRVFIGSVSLCFGAGAALAQPPEGQESLPPPVVGAPSVSDSGGSSGSGARAALSVAPLSLMEQRLHEAAYPEEAEARCLLATSCDFGLSRGFAIGSDLGAVVGVPLVRPILEPGRWLVFDGYVGFQFLRAVDEHVYFNVGIGYRLLEHKDSNDRRAEASGMTFRVAYGQQVLDFYSQGVTLNGFYANNVVDKVEEDFAATRRTPSKTFLDRFYTFSQSYPRLRFGLPADFELINWRNTHIDLPNHLRGYVRAEPFFIQNEFKESFPEINTYTFTEYNYGLRFSYLMSYVSREDRSGRLGFLGGIGFDVQASSTEVSYDNQPNDYRAELPERAIFSPYWELGASYQF